MNKELFEKVEIRQGLQVAKVFADHWAEIEQTALPTVAITAIPMADPALEESKFGHFPYMPLDADYPKDENGKFMYPLAQINFSEIPALEGFPTSGFLQIYIGDNDIYGLDLDDQQSQKNFRVLFFEKEAIKQHKTDFSFLGETMDIEMSPVYKPHALRFTSKTDYVGLGDARYEENENWSIDKIVELYPDQEEEMYDEAFDTFSCDGHKIGGYANFTQEDPRLGNPAFDQYILLLQIDTDDEIMWGDAGVGNFFIHKDDLAKKDFSKVLYNWDCS